MQFLVELGKEWRRARFYSDSFSGKACFCFVDQNKNVSCDCRDVSNGFDVSIDPGNFIVVPVLYALNKEPFVVFLTPGPMVSSSNRAYAKLVLESNKISFETSQPYFNIVSSRDVTYAFSDGRSGTIKPQYTNNYLSWSANVDARRALFIFSFDLDVFGYKIPVPFFTISKFSGADSVLHTVVYPVKPSQKLTDASAKVFCNGAEKIELKPPVGLVELKGCTSANVVVSNTDVPIYVQYAIGDNVLKECETTTDCPFELPPPSPSPSPSPSPTPSPSPSPSPTPSPSPSPSPPPPSPPPPTQIPPLISPQLLLLSVVSGSTVGALLAKALKRRK